MTSNWVRRAPAALAVGAAVLLLVGALLQAGGHDVTRTTRILTSVLAAPVPPVPPVPAESSGLHPHTSSAAVTTAAPPTSSTGTAGWADHGPYWFGPVTPRWVRIPRFGVRAPVIAVDEASDGSMAVPSDAKVVGWWDHGPLPGSSVGSAVLDSHVATIESGDGAFYHLVDMRPGDEVIVDGDQGSVHYSVTQVIEIPRNSDPTPYFADNVPGRLVLITCGGMWDAAIGHHLDNIVVLATPMR